MSVILNKEIAFVKLASKYLSYDTNTLMELVHGGAEISPHLWERIIEKVGNIKFVNKNGYDFEDYSEAKTGSMTLGINWRTGYTTKKGRITNAENKIGYMRVAIWNQYLDSIDYFLLPPDHLCTSYSTKACPQGAITFSYSVNNNRYSNCLDDYKVFFLEDVCRSVNDSNYIAA